MAASRYTREMAARLLAIQPIRYGHEKMPIQGGIVLSPKRRDSLVKMLMEGGECCECTDSLCDTPKQVEVVYKISAEECDRYKFKGPEGFWARLLWVLRG